MIRSQFPPAAGPHFRVRAPEVSRLEALTDAVFGFAITLLVVSLEVPRSFEELFRAMRGFPAFAVCFAALLYLWWFHNRFFRRYGLQDGVIFVLNSVLLFLILFYVYPLKFLFGGLLGAFALEGNPTNDQIRLMFVCYSGGWAAVFLTFTLMFAHAYRKADALGLSRAERCSTVHSIVHHLVTALFGIISVVIALVAERISLAGWIYFGMGLTLGVVGYFFGRRTQLALAEAAPPAA